MTEPTPTTAPCSPVTRPNGKTYRPRMAPRALQVDNTYARSDDADSLILVFGTHDIERAYALAAKHWPGTQKDTADRTWVRETIRNGEPFIEYDDVRGAATVRFEVIE